MRTLADTETPQGIVAVVGLPPDNLPPLDPRTALVLVLDGIRDPGNVGTLLRAAAAAGCSAAVAVAGGADPFAPKVVRAAMGAHFHLPVLADVAWDWLGPSLVGLPAVYGADGAANLLYDDVDWTHGAALVVGNEDHGLSDEARMWCRDTVAIPMARGIESLNAAVSGAVILFEAVRQRRTADELLAWNDAYAASMRDVYAAFPDDLDVSALFAEAMLNRTPWQLWDLKSGEPAQGADTLEAVAVLEEAMRLVERRGDVPHPGVLHFYIHVMEMSPHPERALRASDALRDLVPDAGHLLHMPSHIDILCGDYYAGLVANDRAIRADRKYLEREGAFNGYTFYRIHNYHFKLYAAMFLGQFRPALEAAEELVATIPEALLRRTTPPMADWLEGFLGMKVHALVRFGRWQEILDEPLPDDPAFYCVDDRVVALCQRDRLRCAWADRRCGGRAGALQRRARSWCRDPETLQQHLHRSPRDRRCDVAGGDRVSQGQLRHAPLPTSARQWTLDDSLPYDEPWGTVLTAGRLSGITV